MDEDDLAQGKERRCPICGARVAQRAKTCLMCGASLKEKWHLSSVPVLEILLLLAMVGLVVLWLAKPWRGIELGARSLVSSLVETPTTEIATTPTVIPSPALTSTPTTTTLPSTTTPTPTPVVHIVSRGETLTYIASYYGTTMEAIVTANDIDPEQLLQLGQKLIIPSIGATGGAHLPTPTPEVITHVVQPGDSLYSICLQYGASAEAILAANDIPNPELIRIGQELTVPLGTPTPVPTPTPRPTSTPTPGPPYQAPVPLRPADDQIFHGDEEPIMLAWTSVGILGDDEYYLVHMRYMVDDEAVAEWSEWRKDTGWRVPSELQPPSEARSHLFRWDVTVMRRTGEGSEGEPLSPTSEVRSFYWY